ncbi:sporulation protein YjcZ [Priestia megaterium]|uniref:sporulation protein YjcZ n=1 Tax=Priestia megaterium TaxID=1404 RepID=UPI003F5327DC
MGEHFGDLLVHSIKNINGRDGERHGFFGGCGYGSGYTSNNSAIIVVLFVLLVIAGCSCFKDDY